MNRPSIPTPSRPAATGPVVPPEGTPSELAAALPAGNVVVLGGPGSGKTALLEATMHHLLARPGGSARLLTSSRLAPLVDTRAFTDELAEFVLACERRLIDPDELLERARAEDRPTWVPAAAFLDLYADHLALQDSVDQAGLIVQAGDLLEDRADVLAATVAQVGTILVDEAQELDPAQLRVLSLLVDGGARAILAGDPAGTTDAYRGATPGALPTWAGRLGATVVLLERSRRLGGPGLDAVRRLQAAGSGPAVPLTGGGTTTVEAARYPGPAEEAEANARLLRVAHERDGVPYGRMAVLLPTARRLSG